MPRECSILRRKRELGSLRRPFQEVPAYSSFIRNTCIGSTRAARNVGRRTKEPCPICEDGRLVTVTFVFGAKLPPGGRCPGTAAELKALCRRAEPVLCYEVEVCPACAWHHLMRKYPAGGGTARGKGRARKAVR